MESIQNKGVELCTVADVDIKRYAGRWYEIARLPMRFEEECASDVTATYTLRPDGMIGVLNACRKADGTMKSSEGVARLADTEKTTAKLNVTFVPSWLQFLPFVWADYWVIELDPDYRYAVVGEPDRRYLWILSRTQKMEENIYEGILSRVIAQGYDLNELIRTQHTLAAESRPERAA